MEQFISNCLSLTAGESLVYEINQKLKLVCNRQKDSISIYLNVYADDKVDDVLDGFDSKDISATAVIIMINSIVDRLYESTLVMAHRRYREVWCEERNFPISDVILSELKGEQYEGQMYMNLSEFEDGIYIDREKCLKYLDDMGSKVYNFVFDYLEKFKDKVVFEDET